MKAQFIGVGVGPGDPELITLKAARLIQQADVISFISNENDKSQAKQIASELLQGVDKQQLMLPVIMPMSENRSIANAVYDETAKSIQEQLNMGKLVVFLCEGDPLFFGSFAYLLERLQEQNSCQVVPGISSVHAASSALQLPLVMLQESFAVVSGRHSEEQLIQALKSHESVVIMKAGRSRQNILNALEATGRKNEASYLEYISREDECIKRDISELKGESGPYFSLFVVTSKDRNTL